MRAALNRSTACRHQVSSDRFMRYSILTAVNHKHKYTQYLFWENIYQRQHRHFFRTFYRIFMTQIRVKTSRFCNWNPMSCRPPYHILAVICAVLTCRRGALVCPGGASPFSCIAVNDQMCQCSQPCPIHTLDLICSHISTTQGSTDNKSLQIVFWSSHLQAVEETDCLRHKEESRGRVQKCPEQ